MIVNTSSKYREPLLFIAAALLVCGLCYLLLYRAAPHRSGPADVAATGDPVFSSERHLTALKADSFIVLLHTVYPGSKTSTTSTKLSVSISGQGARSSDFYNDNPYLLKVSSKEFSISHQKTKDEIEATFTLHREGREAFIFVPNDILFQLTEKATNAAHG